MPASLSEQAVELGELDRLYLEALYELQFHGSLTRDESHISGYRIARHSKGAPLMFLELWLVSPLSYTPGCERFWALETPQWAKDARGCEGWDLPKRYEAAMRSNGKYNPERQLTLDARVNRLEGLGYVKRFTQLDWAFPDALEFDRYDGKTIRVVRCKDNGKPCRIRLPEDADARQALVDAHVTGRSMSLTFFANGCEPWNEQVDAVVLAPFCPRTDGLCQFLVIDLDASDHGSTGLADPVHAARVIAERSDNAGLSSGLLVARSRRGRGRHVFLFPPAAVPLDEAVLVIAALAASAWTIASRDVEDYETPHAFRRVDGSIAKPGDAGSFELVPRSTARPPYGWAMTLPAAGAFANQGGGVIVDPFSDAPSRPLGVPCCDREAWSQFVVDARNQRAMHMPLRQRSAPVRPKMASHHDRDPIDCIDRRTRDFLEGRVPEGSRNNAAFAASPR